MARFALLRALGFFFRQELAELPIDTFGACRRFWAQRSLLFLNCLQGWIPVHLTFSEAGGFSPEKPVFESAAVRNFASPRRSNPGEPVLTYPFLQGPGSVWTVLELALRFPSFYQAHDGPLR